MSLKWCHALDICLYFSYEAKSRPEGRRRVTPVGRGEAVPAGGVVSSAPGRLRV